MNTKNVILVTAIAVVILVATIGSASANGVCVGATTNFSCDPATALPNQVTEDCTFNDTMTCPAGTHGLVIWADDITINGDGKTIRRANTDDCGAWAGIWNPPSTWDPFGGWTRMSFANVTVKNLKVENFCSGILIQGYKEPDPGTHKDFVVNNTIDNCEVCNNGNNAGTATTSGVELRWASKCKVTNSDIHDNTGKMTGGCDDGGAGILMYGGSGHTVSNNEVNDNARVGIYGKKGTKNHKIRYNTVCRNGMDAATTGFNGGIGMQCKKSVGWTVEYNEVNDNLGSGIWVRGGMGGSNDIKDNNAKNNTEGIALTAYMNGGGKAKLIRNTVCDNGVDITVCPACTVVESDENACNTTLGFPAGCEYSCFRLYGDVSCSGSPLWDTLTASVENRDNGKEWDATTSDNHYERFIGAVRDVNADDMLWYNGRVLRADGGGCGCGLYILPDGPRIPSYQVTAADMAAGEVNYDFSLNICWMPLEGPVQPAPPPQPYP